MNSLDMAIVVFTIVGVIVAYFAPGIAVGLVVLAVGALALFGPRAGD